MKERDVLIQAALDAVQVAQMRCERIGMEVPALERYEGYLLESVDAEYDDDGNRVGGPTGTDRLSFALALQSLAYFAHDVQLPVIGDKLGKVMDTLLSALPPNEVAALYEIWGSRSMPEPKDEFEV